MRFNKRINFKKSFVIVLWIFIFIIIIFWGNGIKKDIKNQIFKLVTKSIDEKSINLDKGIQDTFKVLSALANNLSYEDLSDFEKTAKSFDSIVKENGFKRIAIVNLQGLAYFNDGEVADISDREYFNNAINGKWYVSSMVFSKLDGKKSNTFSIPIYKDKKNVGILFASILTNKFYESIDLSNLTDLGDSIIINSHGDIIVSHENSIFNSNSLNFFEKLKSKGIQVEENIFNYKAKGYRELKLTNKKSVILYLIDDLNTSFEDMCSYVSIAKGALNNCFRVYRS